MPPTTNATDHTEKVIARSHRELDEHAQRFRRERAWGRVTIVVDFEEGRGISLEVTPAERRLARNL